jgi:FixJ family two-component response regulator
MPGITGVQIAREFFRIRPDIPIILCTGHSETVSPEIAKEAGIREYLMKPLAKQELAEAIRRVLHPK